VHFSSHFSFDNVVTPTGSYTLSLHDALPICRATTDSACRLNRTWSRSAATQPISRRRRRGRTTSIPTASCSISAPCSRRPTTARSEEHTSELQSRFDLVCRLLLEKKKQQNKS